MKNKILASIAIIVFIAGASLFVYSKINQQVLFTPPAAEMNAKSGSFVAPDDLGWTELYQDGMPYKFSICGICNPDDNKLPVWFYNNQENEALLVLEVYDSSENKIAETGFLKPGEYLKEITLDESLDKNEVVNYQVIGYEPENYESLGRVSLTTKLK